MTREEKQKAIDVLKISAPVMAVTQEEFNDYIQTLNKIMDWLEQEPCADAISREAVAEVLLKYAHSEVGKAFAEFLISQINALPPVKPQYTDTEIQKMQDLEFAEIQKAYEIGKDEGSEVLDKIKADLWMEGMNMTGEYQGVWVRYRDIERIIDKYKAESEVQDAD